MGSLTTADLVDRLYVDDVCQRDVVEELVKRRNAVEALSAAVVNHPHEETRHLAAELLRDADQTAAVPALIEALRDRSPHVRFDALSGLSKILKVDVGWWLNIEAYHNSPAVMHRRVLEWWTRNKKYVWW